MSWSIAPRYFDWISPFLLLPAIGFSQTLHLSTASAAPGEQVSIEISIRAHGHNEPVSALQWEVTIPAAQLSFLPTESTQPGPAIQSAGKSVNCADKRQEGENRTAVCILYGGQQPIGDGVVAILRLSISPKAKPGKARIRIDHALAVSKDLKRTELRPVEAPIKIRRK